MLARPYRQPTLKYLNLPNGIATDPMELSSAGPSCLIRSGSAHGFKTTEAKEPRLEGLEPRAVGLLQNMTPWAHSPIILVS